MQAQKKHLRSCLAEGGGGGVRSNQSNPLATGMLQCYSVFWGSLPQNTSKTKNIFAVPSLEPETVKVMFIDIKGHVDLDEQSHA